MVERSVVKAENSVDLFMFFMLKDRRRKVVETKKVFDFLCCFIFNYICIHDFVLRHKEVFYLLVCVSEDYFFGV